MKRGSRCFKGPQSGQVLKDYLIKNHSKCCRIHMEENSHLETLRLSFSKTLRKQVTNLNFQKV